MNSGNNRATDSGSMTKLARGIPFEDNVTLLESCQANTARHNRTTLERSEGSSHGNLAKRVSFEMVGLAAYLVFSDDNYCSSNRVQRSSAKFERRDYYVLGSL